MVLLSHGRHTSSYGPIYVYRHALHPPRAKIAAVRRRRGRRRQRLAVRRPGHVDLVREQLQRRQRRLDRRPGARRRREHAVHQELRRLEQLLEPVLPAAGRRTARQRAEGVRLAVRLRHQPGRRGEPRRQGGRQRRRLPGDRRRGRVRRPLRGRADLHHRPAREDRPGLPARRWPPSPTSPTTPRFPYSVFLGPERRAVQRAADVLEGHRRLGRHGLCEHLHRQPHLRAPDLPARADLRRRVRARTCCASARRPSTTARPGCSFWDWQETPASGWSTLAAPLAPLHERHPEHVLPGTAAAAPRAIRCCGCRSTWPARSPRRKRPASFGAQTTTNLRSLPEPPTASRPSGVADAATWAALLALPPVAVDWTGGGPSG